MSEEVLQPVNQTEALVDHRVSSARRRRRKASTILRPLPTDQFPDSAGIGYEVPAKKHGVSMQHQSYLGRKPAAPDAESTAVSDAAVAVVPAPASVARRDDSLELQAASTHRRRQWRQDQAPEAIPMSHYPFPTDHRPFAHPSEDDFSRILDFYGVQWLYEPRSFPLAWKGDRIVEMFTPDFYLPEVDLYIELTTLKQDLVTEKNRKLRHIKELYPEINIKLLYRRDIHRFLAKYGFGPLVEVDVAEVEKVLFSKYRIERRVAEMGRAISRDYNGEEILLIGVLRGVFCFMADLMRQITLPLSMDFMSVSYYIGGGNDNGGAHITKGPDIDVEGRHVLLVEDIVDTGLTLNYLLKYLQELKPASFKVCAFLDKRVRRLVDVKLDYVGFEAPDEFLVGYGLDYLEKYRNMPFIGVLKPGEQPKPVRGLRKRSAK